MRRFLFWLALMLFAFQADAAPSCSPWDLKAKNREVATMPPSYLSYLFTSSPHHGFAVIWWCDEAYEWKGYGFVGFKDQVDADWEQQVKAMENDRSLFDTLWSTRLVCPDWSVVGCERYLELRPLFDQLAKTTRPPPILWPIKDNPNGISRPVFSAAKDASGVWVRNTTAVSGQRVSDVNTIANCVAIAIVESGGTYCSVSGLPNVSTADPADVLPADRVALAYRAN